MTNDTVSDTEQSKVHSSLHILKAQRAFKCFECQVKHTSKILADLKGPKMCILHPVFIGCYLHCPVLWRRLAHVILTTNQPIRDLQITVCSHHSFKGALYFSLLLWKCFHLWKFISIHCNFTVKIRESSYQVADCMKSLHFKYCSVKHCTENIVLQESSGISQSENASGEEN